LEIRGSSLSLSSELGSNPLPQQFSTMNKKKEKKEEEEEMEEGRRGK
jgi:hypothetical protein